VQILRRTFFCLAAILVGLGFLWGPPKSSGAMPLSPLPPGTVITPTPVSPLIYDSVKVGNLPAGTTYLGYVDGGYANDAAVRAEHPSARILTISTTGASPADILDVEPGDATPQKARRWVASGMGHVIYSDLSDKPLLDAALKGLTWQWYAADPTGCYPHLVPGSVATQYCWTGRYDISETDGSWPAAPPSPTPTIISPLL